MINCEIVQTWKLYFRRIVSAGLKVKLCDSFKFDVLPTKLN